MTVHTPRSPRVRLWREITRFGEAEFTLRDLLARYGELKPDSLRQVLLGLVRRGFVRQVGVRETLGGIKPTKVYVCAFPRVASIPPVLPETHGGRRQLYLWRAMRQIDGWTIAEIAAAAATEDVAVTPACASAYVSSLVKAGIVQVIRPRGSAIGEGSVAATYRLLPSANTGPLAPEIRRGRRVYDVNRQAWLGDACEVSA